MYVKEVTIPPQGLYTVPRNSAGVFIQEANQFQSAIWVERKERRTNGKSLLGLLSLGVVSGVPIRIIADGIDEHTAVDALVELVESGFNG